MVYRLMRPMCVVLLALPVAMMAAQTAAVVPAQVAATATPQAVPDSAHPGTFLLTVFLKHDESKTVSQINAELKANGWYKNFSASGC